MVKRIGKIGFIFFLIVQGIACFAAEITMNILSFDNIEISQVAVGQPFVLEVQVKGVSANTSERPKIKGLKGFDFGSTGFEMRTINGNTTIRYKYNVRIDKKGVYKIGPAEIDYMGDTLKSNLVTIKIGDKQKEKNGNVKKRTATKKVLFNFSTNKTKVVIGEKVTCTLQFFFMDGEDIDLARIIVPDGVKGIHQTKKVGPFTGKKRANSDIYSYVEWKWDIFPTETGKITLPANRADFTVRVDNGFFRGFTSFFNMGIEEKHIYSNAITLDIDPLPSYDKKVNAVGDFRLFTASVDRAIAKQGDGIVLTLEVEGSGDLENLDINTLQGMPESLKYYDSKQYIVDKDVVADFRRKKFEFIIQGMQPGEWQIPKQTFTYFDIENRTYKTLRTSAIMLKILPQSVAAYKPKKMDKIPDTVKSAVEEKDGIRPIVKVGAWSFVPSREIPYIIFILLLLFPFLLLLFSWIKRLFIHYSNKYAPHKLQKYALSNAYKDLKEAARKKDISMIYSIFIKLFAQRFSMPESQISQDFMLNILRKKDFKKDEIRAWERFFAKISSFVFYQEDGDVSFDKEIFAEAFDWIETFRKRL